MGQKVNPINFRIGINKDWKSRWFTNNKKEYTKLLLEDIKLRKALETKLKLAGVHEIDIERLPKAMTIRLLVSRPGIVIGRGGSGIESIKNFVSGEAADNKTSDQAKPKLEIIVEEVKNAELSAKLVAQRIVSDLERRMPHRKVITRTMERVMGAGAKGIKITLSGRINGAEIGRVEKYYTGSVPTQSLRANIDYAQIAALLKSGYVGVKVWVNQEVKN